MFTYRAQEVCRLLGIAKSTLFNWEKANKIPQPTRTLANSRQYDLDAVLSLLKSLSSNQRLQARASVKSQIDLQNARLGDLQKILDALE
jgi:DNA-binding transcriptional MerR regulator